MTDLEIVEHEGALWYPWSVRWKDGDKQYSVTVHARSQEHAQHVVKCMRSSLEVDMQVLATERYDGDTQKH